MTPLRFRAWHTVQKKMYTPEEMGEDELTLSCDGRGLVNVSGSSTRLSEYAGDSMIPMQSTGIRDKNGKEIYEGDVVSEKDDARGVVEWLPALACFIIRPLWKTPESKYYWFNEGDFVTDRAPQLKNTAVTGNRYENPELLSPSELC